VTAYLKKHLKRNGLFYKSKKYRSRSRKKNKNLPKDNIVIGYPTPPFTIVLNIASAAGVNMVSYQNIHFCKKKPVLRMY
jgi:hypothetical protein